MIEAPSFTFHGDTHGIVISIEKGSVPIEDVIVEIARQAIGLARRQSRLPFKQELPSDDELRPLLSHLEFYDDHTILRKLSPDISPDRSTVVDIDYLNGLAVKLNLAAKFGGPPGSSLLSYSAGVDGPIIFHQRLFDLNHGQNSSLGVLRLAMIALDVKNSSSPKP